LIRINILQHSAVLKISPARYLPKHLQNRKNCAQMLTFVPKYLQNAVFSIFDLRFVPVENYLLVDYLC